jgi:hypothetical protein
MGNTVLDIGLFAFVWDNSRADSDNTQQKLRDKPCLFSFYDSNLSLLMYCQFRVRSEKEILTMERK